MWKLTNTPNAAGMCDVDCYTETWTVPGCMLLNMWHSEVMILTAVTFFPISLCC